MAGVCPSCGGPVDDANDRCHHCGQSTTRRHAIFSASKSAAAPAPREVELPCLVPDARFVAGETWVRGQFYLTDLGVYFLADSDGPWTPDRLLRIVPPDPTKARPVAPGSSFVPINQIERFQHSRLTSFSVITIEGKKPLRLEHEGWSMVDGFASKLGIPTR